MLGQTSPKPRGWTNGLSLPALERAGNSVGDGVTDVDVVGAVAEEEVLGDFFGAQGALYRNRFPLAADLPGVSCFYVNDLVWQGYVF